MLKFIKNKGYICAMIYIKSKQLILRTIQLKDLDFLFEVENDADYFYLSDSFGPYTRLQLENYIQNASTSIYKAKQYRFVITTITENPIGFLDLYGYDANAKTVGLGIIIYDKKFRNKGLAKQAIKLIIDYCFYELGLKHIEVAVLATNENSLLLFTSLGFAKYDEKMVWNRYLKEYKLMHYFNLSKNN